MSTSQTSASQKQNSTPPTSFTLPLTPPSTGRKQFPQAHRVLTLFKAIRDGRHVDRGPWIEFSLGGGEYNEIERGLGQDEALSGYVSDKIRYDYDAETFRLAVRMPTAVHEVLIASIEDEIFSQVKSIRKGSGPTAAFAQKLYLARSTEIFLPIDGAPPSAKSRYEPDASFQHKGAKYPGVIIEVGYSQKKKMVARLAENYLMDSNASIQVVIGLDIEYGKRGSRRAALSVWRTKVIHNELRVVQEVKDEVFRDDRGDPIDHKGLRLQLRDFAYEELVKSELGEDDEGLVISAQKLCEYLDLAEAVTKQPGSLGEHSIAPGIKKRKRSETPQELIAPDDEARYTQEEERAAKRMADKDRDYENSSIQSFSE